MCRGSAHWHALIQLVIVNCNQFQTKPYKHKQRHKPSYTIFYICYDKEPECYFVHIHTHPPNQPTLIQRYIYINIITTTCSVPFIIIRETTSLKRNEGREEIIVTRSNWEFRWLCCYWWWICYTAWKTWCFYQWSSLECYLFDQTATSY